MPQEPEGFVNPECGVAPHPESFIASMASYGKDGQVELEDAAGKVSCPELLTIMIA